MFQLQVIQANFGDCFILRFGDPASPRFILIDGGPAGTYNNHLKGELVKIQQAGAKLDLVVVSHVDDDHITGVLELLDDLRREIINGNKNTLEIKSLWHNTFDLTVDKNYALTCELEQLARSTNYGPQHEIANLACYSIKQGVQLKQIFEAHQIPINPESTGNIVSVENMPEKITKENLSLRVVGPTLGNLTKLRKEWITWLKAQKKGKPTINPFFKDMSDKSYTNTSSIMILAEAEGKRILLPGDGRGDQLLEGLKKAGMLDSKGELQVDILKLPHHGSLNNISRKFFDKIIARMYVVSANGTHGHPNVETLKYVVESAKARGSNITLFTTNQTPSLDQLVKDCPPGQYGYSLSTLPKTENFTLLTP